MSKKLEVVLDYKAIGELLRSEDMKHQLEEVVEPIVDRCGEGYESKYIVAETRVYARVETVTPRAMASNLKHNTLLKALHK